MIGRTIFADVVCCWMIWRILLTKLSYAEDSYFLYFYYYPPKFLSSESWSFRFQWWANGRKDWAEVGCWAQVIRTVIYLLWNLFLVKVGSLKLWERHKRPQRISTDPLYCQNLCVHLHIYVHTYLHSHHTYLYLLHIRFINSLQSRFAEEFERIIIGKQALFAFSAKQQRTKKRPVVIFKKILLHINLIGAFIVDK